MFRRYLKFVRSGGALQSPMKRHKSGPAPGPAAPPQLPPPPPHVFTPFFVGVHNIGQGSSVAIYDILGRPRIYFDFGFPLMCYFRTAVPNSQVYPGWGGWAGNNPAFPALANPPAGTLHRTFRNPRACLHNTDMIILSHWDWDHWYQAHANMANIAGTTIPVVAPVQPVGGQALGFWNALGLRVPPARYVWPVGQVCREFVWGYLLKCNGPAGNVNRTGLAALVRMRRDPAVAYPVRPLLGANVAAPVFSANERYILLMGDGEFIDLPIFNAAGPPFWPANMRLVGMTASHHGGNLATPAAQIPTPAVGAPGRITFSYGVRHAPGPPPLPGAVGGPGVVCRHCYTHGVNEGHPRNAAVTAYHGQGWTYRMDCGNDVCAGPALVWGPRQTDNNFAMVIPGGFGGAVWQASFQFDGHGPCAGACMLRNFQT
ncbi:MAG: hypothetical protein OEV49_02420 [candidate division Zixibacteria bacterium]|nr:hypothetical protein [candidate division Zixibacteria bacterium]MDH3938759.1 hypothetical protein [candidate division Zixibacteria bacterium]MDH4035432.1 hypothetical protein [candidate division Zixibacteria bacterium]